MPTQQLIPLGGAYQARSVIANNQRSVNYYPEFNRKDSPSPLTFYQRPGMRLLVQGPQQAPVRGLFPASNGQGYCVIGQNFYRIGSNFQLFQLGQLKTPGNDPVSMSDNGSTLVLADGSQLGYSYDMIGTNGFQQIVDTTGTFVGANKWDYIDTFLIWNSPGTRVFGSTLSNQLTFDPLYVAAKTTYPDNLLTLYVNRQQILLLGRFKSEVWYDAGGALFPFAKNPGVYIEHGCIAPYSVASADVTTYWLAQNLQGQNMVISQQGYQTSRVSNFAVEVALRRMPRIDDAIGYCYQQDGHVFYVLTFPTANQTWVFDAAMQDPQLAWHTRSWTDGEGNLNRDRSNAHANLFGMNVVGDWQNGSIYALDPEYYKDDAPNSQGGPISFIRGFPHVDKVSEQGQMVSIGGKRVSFQKFLLDMDCGNAPLQANGTPAEITLRYSDDRGHTWSEDLLQSAGAPGEFQTRPNWAGLGSGHYRVFEIEHSIAGPAAINGAFVDAMVMKQ